MRIPDGDLAPARRRQFGGSYGRRRRRNQQRAFAAVVLLLAGGGGAYLLLRQDDAGVPDRLAQQRPSACPSAVPAPAEPAPAAALPRPQQVRVRLLNGTSRNGLAKAIGDQLAARGFVVVEQANAPAALAGPSLVAYAAGSAPAATVASQWVVGSRTVADPKVPRGTVQITLGSGFRRLATPAEAAAAAAPRTAAVTPTSTPAGCAS